MPNTPSESLQTFLPLGAWPYCQDLLLQAKVEIRISRARHSKLGDYTFDRLTQKHRISVNRDLNKYSFLITLIHEVAHYYVYVNHKKTKPHGLEWKNEFRELMEPLLLTSVFPHDILDVLRLHMRNPKASTHADHKLLLVLRKHNESGEHSISLAEIETGSVFRLNTRTFEKKQLKRTRYLCKELKSGRNYLISRAALVAPVD